MHQLLLEKFGIEPEMVEIQQSGMNTIYKIHNYGVLKKQPVRDVFVIKNFQHPLINTLKSDAINSYHFFANAFNSSLTQNYQYKKVAKKIDKMLEEIHFNYINANNIEVIYTLKFTFKQSNGHSDHVLIRYIISDFNPIECSFEFFLIPNDGLYANMDKKLEFKINTLYYPGNHGFILAYISKYFLKQVEESFENIENFMYNADENLEILLIQLF